MLGYNELNNCFHTFRKEIYEEIGRHGFLKEFAKGEFVLKENTYPKVLPIVNQGILKVFSQENEVEFLMYYLYPRQTCIFSFTHILNAEPVRFNAVAETDSSVICLPMDKVREWVKLYPDFALHILAEYQRQYNDLLNTTKQIICYNLEDRILLYLRDQAELANSNLIHKSHQKIAADLSTSREVISRAMKKLEKDKKIVQQSRSITLLER